MFKLFTGKKEYFTTLEIKKVMKLLEYNLTNNKIDLMIWEVDNNLDKQVDKNEFVLAMLIELGIVEWGKVPQQGQSPHLAAPGSSAPAPPQGACAWRLRAARHSQGERPARCEYTAGRRL